MTTFPSFEGLLFDLDGTLLDTAPDLAAAANELYKRHRKPEQPFEILRPLAGDGALAFVELGFGLNQQNQGALRHEFVQIYLELFGQHTALFAETEELVQTMVSQNYPWGIVTNKPSELTAITLERFPLLAKADIVVSGDTLSKSKPHPEPILYACKKMGVTPEKCAFIGDHERDIIAGRAAGLYTIIAKYGYLPLKAHLPDWQAKAEINSLDELYVCLNSN